MTLGRMLNPQEIMTKNIDLYTSRSISKYNNFLEGGETYTTYIQQNKITSTDDIGLHNVKNIIGEDSPVYYKQIDNVPMFNLKQLEVQLENGEFGLETVVTSSATIIPDTIKPLVHDFFFIKNNLGKVFLFEITNVTNDRLDYGQFYNIEFELSRIGDDASSILQQVQEKYVMLFNNIGSNDGAIVKEDVYFIITYIESLIEAYIKKYIEYFYDSTINVATIDITTSERIEYFKNVYKPCIYDKFLIKFIIDNDILANNNYMCNINLQSFRTLNNIDIHNYEHTIYYYLEKHKLLDEQLRNRIQYLPMNPKHTPLYYADHTYMQVFYSNCKEHCNEGLSFYLLLSSYFIQAVKYNQTEVYTNIAERMINEYLNDIYQMDNTKIMEVLDILNEENLYPNFKEFYFIPIIIYILKQIYKNLTYTMNKY